MELRMPVKNVRLYSDHGVGVGVLQSGRDYGHNQEV